MLANMSGIIPVESTGLGGQTMQPRHATEGRPWCRQPSFGLWQILARAIVHRHAHAPQLGMGIGMGQTHPERVLANHRIRIEQDHMAPFARPNGLVVGHRKTHVVFVGNDPNPRKPFSDHVHRTIHTPVVHHPHVNRHVVHGPFDGHKALLEERPNVVADNDDAQVGHPL